MWPWKLFAQIGSIVVLVAYFLGVLGGCTMTAMPNDFAATFRQASTAMVTQTDWESVLADVDGNVHNPGLEFEAGIVYRAIARLEGVNGSVSLSGTGSGGAIDPVIRDALIELGVPPETIDQAIIDAIASRLLEPSGPNGAPE